MSCSKPLDSTYQLIGSDNDHQKLMCLTDQARLSDVPQRVACCYLSSPCELNEPRGNSLPVVFKSCELEASPGRGQCLQVVALSCRNLGFRHNLNVTLAFHLLENLISFHLYYWILVLCTSLYLLFDLSSTSLGYHQSMQLSTSSLLLLYF